MRSPSSCWKARTLKASMVIDAAFRHAGVAAGDGETVRIQIRRVYKSSVPQAPYPSHVLTASIARFASSLLVYAVVRLRRPLGAAQRISRSGPVPGHDAPKAYPCRLTRHGSIRSLPRSACKPRLSRRQARPYSHPGRSRAPAISLLATRRMASRRRQYRWVRLLSRQHTRDIRRPAQLQPRR